MKRYVQILIALVIVTSMYGYINSLQIFVKSTDGQTPEGQNFFWMQRPGISPCNFIQNGLHFNVWMTDDNGTESSHFVAGDEDYGYIYNVFEKADGKFGVLTFNLTNFQNQGRKTNMEVDIDDILHIRLMYMNPTTGKREVWTLDTLFSGPPTKKGPIRIYANLKEVGESEIATGYSCFTSDGPENQVVEQDYVDLYPPNVFGYKAKLLFGITQPSHVSLDVLDIYGNVIHSASDFDYQSGSYGIDVDLRDFVRIYQTIGIVLIRLETQHGTSYRKLLSFGL